MTNITYDVTLTKYCTIRQVQYAITAHILPFAANNVTNVIIGRIIIIIIVIINTIEYIIAHKTNNSYVNTRWEATRK